MKVTFNTDVMVFTPNVYGRTAENNLTISGHVLEKNILIPCRVRLFEKLSGAMVADIATDQNGFYEFKNLENTRFFIVAHHPLSQFNAVIQDNVVPK